MSQWLPGLCGPCSEVVLPPVCLRLSCLSGSPWYPGDSLPLSDFAKHTTRLPAVLVLLERLCLLCWLKRVNAFAAHMVYETMVLSLCVGHEPFVSQ